MTGTLAMSGSFQLPPAELVAAASRHHHVEHDHTRIERVCLSQPVEPIKCLESVRRLDDVHPVEHEDQLHNLASVAVVFDHHDVRVTDREAHGSGRGGSCCVEGEGLRTGVM